MLLRVASYMHLLRLSLQWRAAMSQQSSAVRKLQWRHTTSFSLAEPTVAPVRSPLVRASQGSIWGNDDCCYGLFPLIEHLNLSTIPLPVCSATAPHFITT
ncbi:hypothetical protein BKA58DRAFT_167787 [Alternaria rosae]|uniref:uncharacterized protein n=1 Tax=Alternaria rosae TaxID=1187941 RepID=UPI001E8CDA39|nr:uncharacterized protein BKA58DRAFT_167787 [Alternaria rosae]KAH6869936.1 hypothetical protein BKA58DRAFT_167787 [Alternaria rosae]